MKLFLRPSIKEAAKLSIEKKTTLTLNKLLIELMVKSVWFAIKGPSSLVKCSKIALECSLKVLIYIKAKQ